MNKRTLIIPSETQVREFDAKLLLGAIAAERGFTAIVGSRTQIHLRITSLPVGIYVANNVRKSSEKMFRIMERLGFEIVAWDEEGLVTYSPEFYLEKRVSDDAFGRTAHMFAWGNEHANIFRKHIQYSGVPVHVTGNPRVDIMRPELRPYFLDEVVNIKKSYGHFILINTNFGSLNHYVPNLSTDVPDSSLLSSMQQFSFEDRLIAHRYKIFSRFQGMVRCLAERFPSTCIIVRPHVAENHAPWHQAAADHKNIQVVHKGNVIPWILASTALVHNGCTTAVEAFVLRKPAVTYRPVLDERYDTFLPNALSHLARNEEDLCTALAKMLSGELGPCNTEEHWLCVQQYIQSLEGPLASDRIMDIIMGMSQNPHHGNNLKLFQYLKGWLQATVRARSKRKNAIKPGHKNNDEYQRQRFAGISLVEVRSRLDCFSTLLGRFKGLQVHEIEENIFRIVPSEDRD